MFLPLARRDGRVGGGVLLSHQMAHVVPSRFVMVGRVFTNNIDMSLLGILSQPWGGNVSTTYTYTNKLYKQTFTVEAVIITQTNLYLSIT